MASTSTAVVEVKVVSVEVVVVEVVGKVGVVSEGAVVGKVVGQVGIEVAGEVEFVGEVKVEGRKRREQRANDCELRGATRRHSLMASGVRT